MNSAAGAKYPSACWYRYQFAENRLVACDVEAARRWVPMALRMGIEPSSAVDADGIVESARHEQGDDEAGHHEEHVDADEAAAQQPSGVEHHDEDDRHGTQPLYVQTALRRSATHHVEPAVFRKNR